MAGADAAQRDRHEEHHGEQRERGGDRSVAHDGREMSTYSSDCPTACALAPERVIAPRMRSLISCGLPRGDEPELAREDERYPPRRPVLLDEREPDCDREILDCGRAQVGGRPEVEHLGPRSSGSIFSIRDSLSVSRSFLRRTLFSGESAGTTSASVRTSRNGSLTPSALRSCSSVATTRSSSAGVSARMTDGREVGPEHLVHLVAPVDRAVLLALGRAELREIVLEHLSAVRRDADDRRRPTARRTRPGPSGSGAR